MNCNVKYLMKARSLLPKRVLFVCSLWLFSFHCFCQSGTISGTGTVAYGVDGSVTITGAKTFTTHVSVAGETVDNMLHLNAIKLFGLNVDLTGGIKCRINGTGNVILSVYSYDSNAVTKKGTLLYKVKTVTSGTTAFIGVPEDVPSPLGSGTVKSNLIKVLLRNAGTWLADKSKAPPGVNTNLLATTIGYINGQVDPLIDSQLNRCLQGNNYTLFQPIIIEVSALNATIMPQGLKIPGLEDVFELANYFDTARALTVQVKVNGEVKQTYTAGNINPVPLNLHLGDLVTYNVTYQGAEAPQIKGVPGVWIARFAGDLMYYCTPSVEPNEFNPWIGFDSRVHTLQIRNYKGDPDFKLRVPNWTQPGAKNWSWSWTAQRHMDANKTKYVASYTWPKYKILSSGVKQRNNQREGLNVQFLNYWQKGENSDFREYQGKAKYMMGFDDDELLYLNSQYYDAIHHPPLEGGGILKLDSIVSRGMPEGYSQIYDVGTGYPSQGFPLNMMITAYRKNREWKLNGNSNYSKKYDGYEIQDNGTDEAHPDGTGLGNNKAPGVVYIKAGGQVVTIKMNVTSPLTIDRGLYGSLEGERWPAYDEKNIPYTLTGLNGLSISELDKFSMTFQGSNALGNLTTQTKNLKDIPLSEKNKVSTTGRWTALFDNVASAYSAVTAFYKGSTTSDKVIVGGKELKPLFLLFVGEKDLEGKGLGAKIWLNDFRETSTAEYSVPRSFGAKTKYMKPDIRSYTLPVNTATTFQTWDGDPHLTYDPGVEWFLSSRTLAKRIPDSYLDGTAQGVSTPYLKYYIDGVEQKNGRSGKDFSCTWNTPGTYTLKVEYRVNGSLTTYQHKLKIINYPAIPNNKGIITNRALNAQEMKWLGISNASRYRLFEIQDVYSQYMYIDGPRATSPNVNRWAEYNDYASNYQWNRSASSVQDNFIRNYNDRDWFWFNWALHYSSNWRDKLPNGLPPYVGNNQVTRVTEYELDNFANPVRDLFNTVSQARWQHTVPLVSYTDFQGNRMRTNPSCLYDINYIFNNDNGAFTGNVVLPDDPSKIQAPDITDEQKDRQEFYYDLKSGRKVVQDVSDTSPIYLSVRNVYGQADAFIADTRYTLAKIQTRGADISANISENESVVIIPSPIRKGENLNIRISSAEKGKLIIRMNDCFGKLIKNIVSEIKSENENLDINIDDVSSGTYIVSVILSERIVTQKIMILD